MAFVLYSDPRDGIEGENTKVECIASQIGWGGGVWIYTLEKGVIFYTTLGLRFLEQTMDLRESTQGALILK